MLQMVMIRPRSYMLQVQTAATGIVQAQVQTAAQVRCGCAQLCCSSGAALKAAALICDRPRAHFSSLLSALTRACSGSSLFLKSRGESGVRSTGGS